MGSVTVDTIAPVIAITSHSGLTSQSHQTVSGTGEVGTTVTILYGATVLSTTTVAVDGSWSDSVTLSGYGAHSITAEDIDAAGNVGTSVADNITLAHPFAITSAGGLTNQVNQTITGTGEAGTTVTVFDGSTVVGTTTVASDGTWSDAFTLSSAQGAHILSAKEWTNGGTPTLTTLVTFDEQNGGYPQGILIADANGNLYGTTSLGGIFELSATTHTLTSAENFNGANSAVLNGSLISDSDGNLYGTTQYGGANDAGTIFEISASTHSQTILANFSGYDVGHQVSLVDSSGNLFGIITDGGTARVGTIFELDSATHTLTTLATFDEATGKYPGGRLIADASGNLYGTTGLGGTFNYGTIFELNAGTGALTTLGNFSEQNGRFPQGSLVADASGNLYGTIGTAGLLNYGSIFELDSTTHTISTLVTFDGQNGARPLGGLIADADGNLYGMTANGGWSDAGTLFELTGDS